MTTKPTVAQLNELINQHASVLHAVLARVTKLESELEIACERIEKLERTPNKPEARPAYGVDKKYEFSGNFAEANAFAKENCTRGPGIVKTLVDGNFEFHVFFNR